MVAVVVRVWMVVKDVVKAAEKWRKMGNWNQKGGMGSNIEGKGFTYTEKVEKRNWKKGEPNNSKGKAIKISFTVSYLPSTTHPLKFSSTVIKA